MIPQIPDLDAQQIAALNAAHELELVLKVQRMPAVLIIGLPMRNEFVRFSGGMESAENCAAFRIALNSYLDKFHPVPERPAADKVLAIAEFHAKAAERLIAKATEEKAPMDSPLRRNALFHQTCAELLGPLAQSMQ